MNAPEPGLLKEGYAVSNAHKKRRYLAIRFCLAAIIVTGMLVVALSGVAYLQIREEVVHADFDMFSHDVVKHLPPVPLREPAPTLLGAEVTGVQADFKDLLLAMPGVESFAIFDLQGNFLWGSTSSLSLSAKERAAMVELLEGTHLDIIVDPHSPKITSLNHFFGDKEQMIPGLMKIEDISGATLGVMRVERTYSAAIQGAQSSALRIFWYILAGNLLLFFALFYNFQRGLQTIERQEKTLNQHIDRLSNLLELNRNMQKSMKTASSRAVEMNEQFLRRVGSDLHDGPAQTLGYAIMRLNRIAEEQTVTADFHAILEALNDSIEEVRMVSRGLVLPELEDLSLEEALHRVVSQHAKNSQSEVSEYYTDLPESIPLPIKITAYRFVQEGLNNAHRHGQAERCRITALVKDDVLHLSLKDNGMGFRKSQLSTEGGHLGLMGLKDRVESLGGRFSINSELGVGTAIKVSIALTDDAIPA